jgi:hypothetical protein
MSRCPQLGLNAVEGLSGPSGDIESGFALSREGLWQQHCWGLLRDGVLETTVVREKYFGLIFQGKAADEFARGELDDGEIDGKESVGCRVEILDLHSLCFRCGHCAQVWSPNLKCGGRLPRGWWRCCSKGCCE